MKKITGLVLTGGGAKAAYQAGVIAALAEILPSKTIPFPVICGTSAGAINAAYLAANAHDWQQASTRLQNQWSELQLDQVYKTGSFSILKTAIRWILRILLGGTLIKKREANYLLDTKPLEKTLNEHVSFEQIKTNIKEGSLRGISFTMVEYFSTESITFFDGAPEIEEWKRINRFAVRTNLTSKHVMASSAIPIFFPPIEINHRFYGDGSLRQTTPLSSAIHLGADRILSVGIRHERKAADCGTPNPKLAPPSLAQISGELMNSIFLDTLDTDIERLQGINQGIEFMELGMKDSASKLHLRKVSHLHLCPSKDLQTLIPNVIKKFPRFMQFMFKGLGATSQQGNNLMGYLSFFPECSKPLMDLGYQDTIAKKEKILAFFAE